MEVVSLRNLKIVYFKCLRSSVVIPPQCLRCIGWNLLLLAQCLTLRMFMTDEFITDKIGMPVWNVLIFFAILSGIFSLLTVFTDPGILPPVSVPPTPEEQAQSGGCEMLAPNQILEHVNPQLAQFEIGMQQFCRKCHHLRPPQAAHCWWSDVCITEMDHYCIILGVVVGARNLRWFMGYLVSIMATSSIGMVVTFKSLESVFYSGPKLLIFVGIICASLIAFASTSYFFVNSFRLIVAGQSTRGEIKGLQTSAAAPKGRAALWHMLVPTLPTLLPMYFDRSVDDSDIHERSELV
eukprot:GILI01013612.1.p1 GENE.GILI01013612.1~~GILI01013612.1.p1  ORF type:complete len:316 (+),score=19.75 GILI01013612.1:67-948(+)